MSVLERDDEAKLLDWCQKQGLKFLKLRLASESAWPDRSIPYKGQIMFIELKRKGESPTPLQLYTLAGLAQDGFFAMWTDDIEVAKARINGWRNYVDSCPRLDLAEIRKADGSS